MLTVLLATRNRSAILRQTLEGFCRLQVPEGGWKVVVVDNGSSDQTEALVHSFSNRLPVQFICEKKQGKNFALNAGLAHIEGDLTVLTDDDVIARTDWLLRLRDAANAHQDFALFGGSIEPYWPAPAPRWVRWIDQGAAYAATDPAWKEGPIAANCLWGPNTAIRSAVFASGIRFNTAIGPNGKSYVQGGDTELTRRLEGLGYKAWHVHDAVVQHYIREEQMSLQWAMRRAVRHGRGEFRLGQLDDLTSRRMLFGAPGYLYKRLFREARTALLSWMLGRSSELYRSRWRFNFTRGQIQEARLEVNQRRAGTGA